MSTCQVKITTIIEKTYPDGHVSTTTKTEYTEELLGDEEQTEEPTEEPEAEACEDEEEEACDDEFVIDALNAHNQYRSEHQVEPLVINSQLCNYAQEWANHLASIDTMYHRPDRRYGENIFCTYSSSKSEVDGSEAVDAWYNEINDYTFDPPTGFSSGTGHFTQVVWASSKKLGIAQATSPSGTIYVVANYDPPGNMMGAFEENVLPPM